MQNLQKKDSKETLLQVLHRAHSQTLFLLDSRLVPLSRLPSSALCYPKDPLAIPCPHSTHLLIPSLSRITPPDSGQSGTRPLKRPLPRWSGLQDLKPQTSQLPPSSAAPPSALQGPQAPVSSFRTARWRSLLPPVSHSQRMGQRGPGRTAYSSRWPHLSSKSLMGTPPPPARK
jgi:hypothetical protein